MTNMPGMFALGAWESRERAQRKAPLAPYQCTGPAVCAKAKHRQQVPVPRGQDATERGCLPCRGAVPLLQRRVTSPPAARPPWAPGSPLPCPTSSSGDETAAENVTACPGTWSRCAVVKGRALPASGAAPASCWCPPCWPSIPLPHPKEILPPEEPSLSTDHALTAKAPPSVSPHRGESPGPAEPHSPGPRGSPAQQAGAGAN